METLPIKFLTDEDSLIFGSLNVSLGKLARAGLPVVDGLVTVQVNSEPKIEIFIKNLKASGSAYYDPFSEDVLIDIKSGKLHPRDLKKIVELVNAANKKIFIPHVYEWILDGEVKLTKLLPYTPMISESVLLRSDLEYSRSDLVKTKSAVKVFLDLSEGLTIEKDVDGIFIDSLKISDIEELTFKLVEAAMTFSTSLVLFKLADISKDSNILDFVRHKKGLTNVHIVIPVCRLANEFLQIKRDLAAKKLASKNSLQMWLELAVPENIINLEDYLLAGLDGVILNLDELLSHFAGFDLKDESLSHYKKEVRGLLKLLEDAVRLLHKSKVPFLAAGSIVLYSEVLQFLVEKGVYGIVVERYEAHSMNEHLHQAEKRMILRKGRLV